MQYVIDSIKWLRQKFGIWTMVFIPLYVFIQIFLENILLIQQGLDDATASVNSVAGGPGFPQIVAIWNAANYFFPVEAAFAMGSFLLQLRILAAAIRSLKSWTPVIWS